MITSVSDHSNMFAPWLLRQPSGDVVDRPGTLGLDRLDVVPAGQLRDRAALNGEDLAGDRAFLRRQVGDQRRDVGRAEQVELAVLGFAASATPMPGVARVSRVRAIGAIALTRTP